LTRLFQPAFAAAYALDPLYGKFKSEQFDYLPALSDEHETMARAVILSVGGAQAVAEFNDFMLTGWEGSYNAAQLAANCANSLSDDVELVPGSKRKRKEVASVDQRANVWRKKGATVWPERTKVALKLLVLHPTSASTERNWSLWGRVYVASRNALDIECARKMITF
jgi:hypothetical protein